MLGDPQEGDALAVRREDGVRVGGSKPRSRQPADVRAVGRHREETLALAPAPLREDDLPAVWREASEAGVAAPSGYPLRRRAGAAHDVNRRVPVGGAVKGDLASVRRDMGFEVLVGRGQLPAIGAVQAGGIDPVFGAKAFNGREDDFLAIRGIGRRVEGEGGWVDRRRARRGEERAQSTSVDADGEDARAR